MSYPNRLLCDVLEEMRKCYECRNFAHLLGLIEEAQMLANRMEAALDDQRDIKALSEERHRLSQEVKKLNAMMPKKTSEQIDFDGVKELLEDLDED